MKRGPLATLAQAHIATTTDLIVHLTDRLREHEDLSEAERVLIDANRVVTAALTQFINEE